MRINDDFALPVIVHGSCQAWTPSPAPGVERRMLFRIGEEKARATSLVRYAPGSSFARHVHAGGEEFLVLEGTFQDGEGDYPAGTYVRNSPGTAHSPAAKDGATIFVRLWQFREDDRVQVVRRPGEGQPESPRAGGETAFILFADDHEEVRLEQWRAQSDVLVQNSEGLELLLVAGSLLVSGEEIAAQGWVRLPAGTDFVAKVGPEGATIWVKLAPLLHLNACPF
jgi:anti-sigma factor ChrR (cupin superfamily)